MNKKIMGFSLLCCMMGLTGAVVFSSTPNLILNLKASNQTTWKHFAAVMPTNTTEGIREYWTDCVGSAPVFEAPDFVDAVDATLTQDQINAILSNRKDERIIPTLDRIQSAVNKHVDGTSANDLTFVNDALGYTYLNSETKASISGANESAILSAKATFDQFFKVVYDVGKDPLPGKDQGFVTIERGYDSERGDVLLINTTEGRSGGTSELYFYGINQGVTYESTDFISFSVYSPFPAATGTSQTYWCGVHETAKKFNATPNNWTNISCMASELNSNGAFDTQFTSSMSLQRYVSSSVKPIEPYEGKYKLTSIIVKKNCLGEHNVTSWTTTKLPTIISEGVKEGRCEVCGDMITAPVARLLSTAAEVSAKIAALPNASSVVMKTAVDVAEINKAIELLDAEELGKLTTEQLDKFNAVKEATAVWSVIYDPIVNGLPTVRPDANGTATVSYEFDNARGTVLTVDVTHNPDTYLEDTFDLPNVGEVGDKDIVNISVYSPFATLANTSQSIWFDTRVGSKVQNLYANSWKTISKHPAELTDASENKFNSFTLQRYYSVPGPITEPYSGTYKVSPIVIDVYQEPELPTEENAIITQGANNITDRHTWDATETEITYNVDTVYGNATQVDIKDKKGTVIELQWDKVSYEKFVNYDYVRMYVYARTTQRVYVSLNDWRRNVVNLPGIEPFASDNGARANNVQGTANVVADQWNIIEIPTSYFLQDTDSTFFIEIWNDKSENKDGWLFSDLHGCNEKLVAERLKAYNASATVEPYNDAEKGLTTKVKVASGVEGNIVMDKAIDVSAYKTIHFSVKNLMDKSIKLRVYKITANDYGNILPGQAYYQPDIKANSWGDLTIDIAQFYGSKAGQCLLRLQLVGATNDSCLITPIYASK